MSAMAVKVAGLAVTVAAARAAYGQENAPPPEDVCEEEESITFDAGSTEPDLTGVAELGEATNWIMAEPGRYLIVAGPDASANRLGPIRATSAAAYMTTIGVDPGWIQVT